MNAWKQYQQVRKLETQAMLADRKAGMKLHQIADKYGYRENNVQKRISGLPGYRHTVGPNGPSGPRPETIARLRKIRQLRQAGQTFRAIGKELGISGQAAYRLWQRYKNHPLVEAETATQAICAWCKYFKTTLCEEADPFSEACGSFTENE